MTAARRIGSLAVRLGAAALLLAWVFHAIFHDQSRAVLAAQGAELDALPRLERWALVWRLGPERLWQTIVEVQPGWLAASVALWGATLALGTWRWQCILAAQGLPLSFARAGAISLVAHFFNSFLLGSTGGDVLKAWYAARLTHHRKTEAVTTVVMDRLIGLFALLAFAAALIPPNWTLVREYGRVAAVALVILGMLAGVGLLLALSLRGGVRRIVPGARELLRRLPRADLVERALDACRLLGRDRRLLVRCLALSFILNLVCVFQMLTLVWGYGLRAPFGALCFIVPATICIAALPLTPSGLGVRDNLYVYLLTLPAIGLDAARALAISLVAYACSLAWSVIGGMVYVRLRHETPELGPEARAGQSS